MNCPYCGNPVDQNAGVCDICGKPVKIYKKLMKLSALYYNDGLERAQVRDLSGAIPVLQKSLEINKKNSDARNLLALCYYEMGEVVEALTQWVLSKNLDPVDNEADYFLEKTQENPTEFDNMNQAVKKYNLALVEAKQGHVDLAVIQLRKAISLCPKFIKAIQLLSLLYIKNGDTAKAEKLIRKGLKVDISNTVLLRYLHEIEPQGSAENSETYFQNESDDDGKKKGNGIFATFSYKEDKPSIMPFVNLIIGVIIGILVVYYLIVPTVKDDIRSEYESQKVDYSAELSSKTATIAQQNKTINSLNKRISELEIELDSSTSGNGNSSGKSGNYIDFFEALELYNDIKSREYNNDELRKLALSLWRIDDTTIGSKYARELLSSMRTDIYALAARDVYMSGKVLIDEESYDLALEIMQAASDMDPESDTAMYYLARTYQGLEEYDKAIECYNKVLTINPNSTLKEYIPERLSECGATE